METVFYSFQKQYYLLCLLFFYVTDDYNRVVLEPIEGESDSDYVNASYVDVSEIYFKCSCMNKSFLA